MKVLIAEDNVVFSESLEKSDNALLRAKKKGRNWAILAKALHDPFKVKS
jgi:hypothetical protein